MAKDGTARGGARIGSGKKPTKKKKLEVLTTSFTDIVDLVEPGEIEGVEVPPIKDYLKAKQKNGKDFYAEDIFKSTYLWLKKRGCEKLVGNQLIEQYAMSVSRWIQCEEAVTTYGFLAKHPTTGNAIQSPYVAMGQNYMNQTNRLWYEIFQIVKENCTGEYSGANPQDDVMERLLNARRGK
mgnify:CR=1 FL=1